MLTNSSTYLLDFDPYKVDININVNNGQGTMQLENDVRFIRARAGASSPVGQLALVAAPVANHINLTSAVNAIGSTNVTFTNGTTPITASQYAGGILVVNAGTGFGNSVDIKDNPAISASVSGTLELARELPVALDATSRLTLIASEYSAVAPAASAPTRRAAGVPKVTVPLGSYAWFQTKGMAPVLAGAAISAGAVLIPGTTSGSVDTSPTVGGITSVRVGHAGNIALVSGEYRPAMLDI